MHCIVDSLFAIPLFVGFPLLLCFKLLPPQTKQGKHHLYNTLPYANSTPVVMTLYLLCELYILPSLTTSIFSRP